MDEIHNESGLGGQYSQSAARVTNAAPQRTADLARNASCRPARHAGQSANARRRRGELMRKRIAYYPKPAGGMDALKASLAALSGQGIVAKGMQTLRHANQPAGFDCPGCAWPDRNHHSSFEFCENGVKAVAAEATNRRVTREFFAEHPISALM